MFVQSVVGARGPRFIGRLQRGMIPIARARRMALPTRRWERHVRPVFARELIFPISETNDWRSISFRNSSSGSMLSLRNTSMDCANLRPGPIVGSLRLRSVCLIRCSRERWFGLANCGRKVSTRRNKAKGGACAPCLAQTVWAPRAACWEVRQHLRDRVSAHQAELESSYLALVRRLLARGQQDHALLKVFRRPTVLP